jgi:hypothetical protein
MHTRSITLAGATATALLLTGCGAGDDRTGPELVEDAATALQEAGSVSVAGTADMNGEEAEIDLHVQEDGATGTVTVQGTEVELLLAGDQAFMQAPADFWTNFGVPAEAAAGFEGQWLLLPAETMPDLGPVSLDGLVDELRNPDSEVEDEVTEGEVDGEDVLIATTAEGSTLSVLAGDDSYPVRIESTGDEGVMNLSRFGETEDISAPADFIDLSQLAG